MKQEILLSIIIPVYNEASRQGWGIKEHLESITKYFNDKNISYEIIVVNDGSKDNTVQVIKNLQMPNLILINRQKNKGKSFSVREGLLKAQGKYRLFTDADGAIPINALDDFGQYIGAGEHVLIGSRGMKQSNIKKRQPKWKEFIGNLGNWLIQHLLGLHGIKDTQCGFKVFSQEAVGRIIPQVKAICWGGDFEILVLAKKIGYKIIEIPVTWTDSGQSTVNVRGYLLALKELFQVKWRLVTGKYDVAKKNKILLKKDNAK